MATATLERPARAAKKPAKATPRPKHDSVINLRMPSQTRDLIDAAATVMGKSRTEFVLESARIHAIDVLLDQRIFRLNEAEFAAFEAVLSNPPEPTECLKRLFKEKELHAQGPVYAAPSPLVSEHDLTKFDCEKDALNDWLRIHAHKAEGRSARTYVVTRGNIVVAYYCISTGGVMHSEAPSKLRRNMPDPIPVMKIGRLAVDVSLKGEGFGKGLLKDALSRILSLAQVAGVRGVMVHAVDEEVVSFYLKFGFKPFPQGSLTLFLPIETVQAAIV